MSLSKHIQDKIDVELDKLRENLELEFNETRQYWDKELASIKKIYNDEIEQEVNININFQKFQNSKTSKFNSGYALQSQLDDIYKDILPDIVNTSFVQQSIQNTLKDIPTDTTLTVTGKYAESLKDIIEKLGYPISQIDHTSSLGTISAKLEHLKLEIKLEDILEQVKQKTLPIVIKSI